MPPQIMYVRERVGESIQAMGQAMDKLREAYAATGTIPTGPGASEVILVGKLSPREREILKLFARGMNYKEIADVLGISPATVRIHRTHIVKHLKTGDIATLTRIAIRNGLVELYDRN